MKFTGKCTGHCCEVFPMGIVTPEDLRLAYLAWKSGAQDFTNTAGKLQGVYQDIWLLYPMARFHHAGEDGRHYFSCVHWDAATRLCGIYEIRPAMCNDYPYRGKCQHAGKGCTFEVVEEKFDLAEVAKAIQEEASHG